MSTLAKRLGVIFDRRLLFPLVFAQLILLCFYTGKQIWISKFDFDLLPYKMLLPFSILFWGFTYLLEKKKAFPYLWLVPFSIILLSERVLGLAGFLIFLLESFVVGQFLIKKAKIAFFDNLSKIEQTLISCFLGLGLLGYLHWYLTQIKVNYAWVYYGIACTICFLGRAYLQEVFSFAKRSFNQDFRLGHAVVFFIASIFLTYVVSPVHGWDEIEMYFYVPKLISKEAFLPINLNFVAFWYNNLSCFPLFTIPYLLGGEFACRFLILFSFLAGLLLTESFAHRRFGKEAGLLSVLTFATIPFLIASMGRFQLDSIDMYSGAALLILFYEIVFSSKNESSRSAIILFFATAAFAFLIRLQAFVIIFPLSVGLLIKGIQDWRRGNRTNFIATILGGLLFVALFSPGLIRNAIYTGNPVFPLFNDIFLSPKFHSFSLMNLGIGKLPSLSPKLLRDITFNFTQPYLNFQVHRFGLGFLYFIFITCLPLVLLRNGRIERRPMFFLSTLLIGAFAVYHLFFYQIRYLVGVFPLASVLVAYTVIQMKELAGNPYLQKLPLVLFFFWTGVNFLFQYQAKGIDFAGFGPPIKQIITHNYEQHPLRKWTDTEKFFAGANVILSKDKKALMSYSPANFYADFNIEQLDWYFFETEQEIAKLRGRSLDEVYDKLFHDMKYDALILTYPDFFGLAAGHYIEKVFSHGQYALWMPRQKIEFGKELRFGQIHQTENPKVSSLLKWGWQSPDLNTIWTKGKSSLIELVIPRHHNQAIQVQLHLSPLIHGSSKEQRLEVKVNGKSFVNKIFKNPRGEQITIDVDSALNDGLLNVELIHPDAKILSSVGIGEDQREVAFMLDYLKITPVKGGI